jgi:EmrB/QacA subfamily drug resistance transporter
MQRKLLVLLCVSVPSFMINLDANIVAVSLTSIAHSLHADFAAIEWVISAYTLAFATLLMPSGALADRFGRKRMLLTGLAIFTVASAACGAAHSTAVLDWARALQGVGAALQLSSALAILSHGFRGAERARAFAFWGSVIGVAIMLGPVAGGIITQLLGWQWAFYVNLPVGAAMIALTCFAVQESKDPDAMKIDFAGVATLSAFLGLTTLALISGNHAGWSSKPVVLELVSAAVCFAAFIAVEAVQKRPMVDLSYFRRRTYLGASIAGVAYAAAFLTMLTYLPFFFQGALGFSPLIAGFLMLPLAVPLFVVPRIVAIYFDQKLSGRTLLVIGLALVGGGLLLTSFGIGSFSYVRIAQTMFIASVGAGILNGQIAKVSMTVIPPERAGMASGVSGTMRFGGIVVGFAALGAVLFHRVAESIGSALPLRSGANTLAITRAVANGDLASATSLIRADGGAIALAKASMAYGYQGVLFCAALIALMATIACFALVSAQETAPHRESETRMTDLCPTE